MQSANAWKSTVHESICNSLKLWSGPDTAYAFMKKLMSDNSDTDLAKILKFIEEFRPFLNEKVIYAFLWCY